MDMLHETAPETKSAPAASAEVAQAFDEFARTFDAFREANDERLSQIETRLAPDVLSEEKLARIDRALDEAQRRLDRFQLDSRRPVLGAAAERRDPMAAEHKGAFDLYVRSGEAAGLKVLEAKAMSAGSGPDGGYLVPETVEKEVLSRLASISPIRAIASVRMISSGQYKRAFSTAGPRDGLGRRDGGAAADGGADPRGTRLPGHGALCDAGGDPGAARRCRREY